MSITKLKNGKWRLDTYFDGRDSPRIREEFTSKAEANRRKAYIDEQRALGKPWNPKAEKRKMTDLIDYWYKSYGKTISTGDWIKARLTDAAVEMGNPRATDFDTAMFDQWRTYRLNREETKTQKRNSPQTLNKIQRLFGAMFNRLQSTGNWQYGNPLQGLMKLKELKPTPGFLSEDDVDKLMLWLADTGNTDLVLIAEICLRTGARWSEAESLTGNQLFAGTPPRITFVKTKGDEDRAVPVSQAFFDRLPKVGPGQRLFNDCYSHYTSVFKRLKLNLPKGQRSHVLRHTFASRFMANGGNIKVLQKIMGHKDVEMTMRYVSFSPDYLTTAIDLNPLSGADK